MSILFVGRIVRGEVGVPSRLQSCDEHGSMRRVHLAVLRRAARAEHHLEVVAV